MNTPPALTLPDRCISPSCSRVSRDAWRNSGVGSVELSAVPVTRNSIASLPLGASPTLTDRGGRSIRAGPVHPRLSVSAVSSWRWSFDDDLRFWSEPGSTTSGCRFARWRRRVERAVAALSDAGLRVSNIVELGWWDLVDRSTWPRQQDRLLVAVDVARAFGACLVLTTGPAGDLEWDAAADALRAAVEPVHAAARDAGVPVTIEPTSPLRLDLSFVTTFRDGVDLARRIDALVCMEVNSCFAERDLARSIARPRTCSRTSR